MYAYTHMILCDPLQLIKNNKISPNQRLKRLYVKWAVFQLIPRRIAIYMHYENNTGHLYGNGSSTLYCNVLQSTHVECSA